VKLAEPLKLHFEQVPERFARDLRAIGQDLANLFPYDLAIELQGTEYVARGHCARKRIEVEGPKAERSGVKSFYDKYLNRDLHTLFPKSQPEVIPEANTNPEAEIIEFSRRYSPEDIDRLDEAGLKHRTGMNRIPDARNLGESLRTIGRLIDANKCHLTFIKKQQDHIAVEYRDADDQPQKQELTDFELNKLQRLYYKNRGSFNPIDRWKGSDK
jgi:hypothetical protein